LNEKVFGSQQASFEISFFQFISCRIGNNKAIGIHFKAGYYLAVFRTALNLAEKTLIYSPLPLHLGADPFPGFNPLGDRPWAKIARHRFCFWYYGCEK